MASVNGIERDMYGRIVIPPLPVRKRKSPWRFVRHPLFLACVLLITMQAMVTGSAWYIDEGLNGFLQPDKPRTATEPAALTKNDGKPCLVATGSTLLPVEHDYMITRVTVNVVSVPPTGDMVNLCAVGDSGVVNGAIWSNWTWMHHDGQRT